MLTLQCCGRLIVSLIDINRPSRGESLFIYFILFILFYATTCGFFISLLLCFFLKILSFFVLLDPGVNLT